MPRESRGKACRLQGVPAGTPESVASAPSTAAGKERGIHDETPGGSSPTPDQDRVDDIGRAYGVQEVDSGALRTTSEILDERDRRRALLEVPDQNE